MRCVNLQGTKNAESYTFNFILALSISFILHEKNSKNKSKRYNE